MKTKEFLAYVAGIIDGEGCLTISKQIRKTRKSPAYRISITVSNTDRRLVDFFKDEWGGVVAQRPDARKEKNWADSFTWYCKDSSVKTFLNCIIPYLRAKKEQALILLDFYEMKSNYKRKSFGQGLGTKPLTEQEISERELIYQSVKKLNSKGLFSRKSIINEQPKQLCPA